MCNNAYNPPQIYQSLLVHWINFIRSILLQLCSDHVKNPSQILHKAWQYNCHVLCKISERFVYWENNYGQCNWFCTISFLQSFWMVWLYLYRPQKVVTLAFTTLNWKRAVLRHSNPLPKQTEQIRIVTTTIVLFRLYHESFWFMPMFVKPVMILEWNWFLFECILSEELYVGYMIFFNALYCTGHHCNKILLHSYGWKEIDSKF